MKRYFVRRGEIGWEIYDRTLNTVLYRAIPTKRLAQDRTNSLNYRANLEGSK